MSQPNPFLREVGARLSEARDRAGLTQAEAAKGIGIERAQTVGDWELGKYEMNISTLEALARLYRTSTDWLLGLAETPKIGTTGGIINLRVERAILAATSLDELEAAARKLDVIPSHGILFGYAVPSESAVLDEEQWASRRDTIQLKIARLKRGPGKRQQEPPPPRRG